MHKKQRPTMNATTNNSNRKSAASAKAGRRKTRRSNAMATAAALGCVVLAASGHVEAFGPTATAMVPLSPTSVRRSAESIRVPAAARVYARRAVAQDGDSDRSQRSSFALGYRLGDDEDCLSQQEQHDDAAASIDSAATLDRPAGINPLSSVWDSIVVRKRKYLGRKGRSASEQFVLDDYLEFCDRRYNRLHDEDEKKVIASSARTASADARGINTAWNWLMQTGPGGVTGGDGPQSDLVERQRQEDALEVLGLAELASAELLRKHHLPIPEDAEPSMMGAVPSNGSTTAVVIDASIVPEDDKKKTADTKEVFMPSGSSGRIATIGTSAVTSRLVSTAAALKRIHERQAAIAALAVRSVVYGAVSASVRSVRRAVDKIVPATAAVLAMVDGSAALRITTVTAMALMIVLRPLGNAVLKSAQS